MQLSAVFTRSVLLVSPHDVLSAMGDSCLVAENDAEFKIHRILLARASPVLRAMFQAASHTTKKFKLNVSEDALGVVVAEAHIGKGVLNVQNVQDVLVAASMLLYDDLVAFSCSFLQKHVDAYNCIGILQFAQFYMLRSVEEVAMDFIFNNFPVIATMSPEFRQMGSKDLIRILSDDRLQLPHEICAYFAALKWMVFDPANRTVYLPALLSCVRYAYVPPDVFLDRFLKSERARNLSSCSELLNEAFKISLRLCCDPECYPATFPLMHDASATVAREPSKIIIVTGGWNTGHPVNTIEAYDATINRWRVCRDIGDPTGPRAYHGCIVQDGEMYIIGGYDGVQQFNSVRALDLQTLTWSSKGCMNSRRCYVSVASLRNRYIYAMGGYDGVHRQDTVERYDPHTNLWTICAPMRVQRSDSHAVSYNDRIFMTGGFNGHECMRSFEYYHPDENRWILLHPMTSRRSGICTTVLDNYIYALGGFSGSSRLNTAERWSPETNEWHPIASMYSPRSNFATVVSAQLMLRHCLRYNRRYLQFSICRCGVAAVLLDLKALFQRHHCQLHINSDVDYSSSARLQQQRTRVKTIDNCLYVFGGFNGATTIRTAECYDPRIDAWSVVRPANINRSALYAAVLDKKDGVDIAPFIPRAREEPWREARDATLRQSNLVEPRLQFNVPLAIDIEEEILNIAALLEEI